MRFILAIFLTAFFAIAPAVAQVRDVTPGSITPGFYSTKNYIRNPSCLANRNDITDASSIVTRVTSGGLVDGKSCQIDATAGSQLVKFTMRTFDGAAKNQNCEARFTYSGDGSLYQAYVEEGGSNTQLTGLFTLGDATSTTRVVSLGFPCGDPANAKRLVIASTGNGAAIQTALGYAGIATNTGLASVDTEFTSYSPGFNSTTGHASSNGWWYRNGDKAVIGGSILWNGTGAGTTFTFTIPSACTIDLAKMNDSASISSIRNRVGSWSWYDDSGGLSINPQWARANTTSSILLMDGSNTVVSNIFANNDRTSWVVEVPCVGWAASNFVTPSSQGWFAAGFISGANPSLGGSAVATYAEIANGSLSLTTNTGSAPVGIACASTNSSVVGSSTCSVGNEIVGVTTNIPTTGVYEACFQFGHIINIGGTAGGSLTAAFQVVETANSSGTVTQEANGRVTSGAGYEGGSNSPNQVNPVMVCGQRLIKVYYEQAIPSGTIFTNEIQADASSAVGQRNIYFIVKPVTSGVPSPILVGSATSTDAITRSRAEIINTVKAVAADYTALFSDETIEVDSSAAARTITLPALASSRGKKFEIVPTSDTNRVIIDGNGSETICGQTTISLFGTHDKVTLQAGSSGWTLADGQCTRSASGLFAGGTRTTACTSTPCTIYMNKGNWISSVTRSGTGQYSVNIATGVFGTGIEPECVFSSANNAPRFFVLTSASTATLIDLNSQNSATSNADSVVSLKCSGPR